MMPRLSVGLALLGGFHGILLGNVLRGSDGDPLSDAFLGVMPDALTVDSDVIPLGPLV